MEQEEILRKLKTVDIHAVSAHTALDIVTYRLAIALGMTIESDGTKLMRMNELLDAVEIKLGDLDILMGGK